MEKMLLESVYDIEVVIKITERCNINCTYCYMFNKGNDDYKVHPSHIQNSQINLIADFLFQGISDLGAKRIGIVFHGGEPLLLKKNRFADMCETLLSKIQPIAEVNLAIQTNAMLVDEEWIDIFQKYRIAVGVSLDGDREDNDFARLDHKSKGTYDRSILGLKKLKDAALQKRIKDVGANLRH